MRKLVPLVVGVIAATLLALTLTACGSKTAASSTPAASAPAASTAMVTTLAGQAGAKGSADGSGSAATFSNPLNIAADAAGNLYVTDDINNTIRKITSAGQVTTLAGKAGSKGSTNGMGVAARFTGPFGIACDTAGNLYVSESDNNTIRKITSTGKVTTVAGKAGSVGSTDGVGAAARFDSPCGIARDAVGNLFIVDGSHFTIRKITPAGKVTTLAGQSGSQGSADGVGAAARFMGPTGIACDSAGNLYVTDSANNTIRKITSTGKVTTLAGKAGSAGGTDGVGAAASFNNPTGIACDASGNLYVCDSDNCAIRKITPAGQVTTVAGKAGSVGGADGSGAAATFNDPTGIACDSAGNLYVCDYGNDTIRKITFGK
jgi:sugar lactone lactonase YvrE